MRAPAWMVTAATSSPTAPSVIEDVWEEPIAPWVNPLGGAVNAGPATAAGPSVDDVVRTDGGPQETPDDPTTLTPVRNGPLYVRGDVEVRDLEGAPLRRDTRLSLCRCGQDRRMPLCDNTCQAMNWQEPVPADTAGRTGGPESAPPSPRPARLVADAGWTAQAALGTRWGSGWATGPVGTWGKTKRR